MWGKAQPTAVADRRSRGCSRHVSRARVLPDRDAPAPCNRRLNGCPSYGPPNLPGTDLQGDERERALRAAAVVAGTRICEAAAAAAAADGPEIEPWQLSMFLLHREEQAQRQRQREGQGGGEAAAAAEVGEVPRRHVAKGTVAY